MKKLCKNLRETIENVINHRDIKLVTTGKRRNQLVSEPNYCTIKWFSKNFRYFYFIHIT